MTGRRLRGAALAALTIATLGMVGGTSAVAAPGDVEGVDLRLLGQHDLASPGHDGQTRARGQNGDLDVAGDLAFVAGGARFHGAQSTPGRICTDYGGVKVVDVSDPTAPDLRSTIEIEDEKGIQGPGGGPVGGPRRGQSVPNVSVTASSVDAIDHPVADKRILAIATQRCEQSFFNGARIEFWDVSNPDAPVRVGDFDPEDIANPQCTPGATPEAPPVCPPGVRPNAAWGIFEDVRMFTRNNGPGNRTRVYAVATTPFSIGNAHDASPQGDFRLIDVTDPANPRQLKTFPEEPIGQNSANGCRIFQAGRSAAPTPDGNGAILSWYDGAQPRNTTLTAERTGLGGPDSAALFHLDLDNLPQHDAGSDPPTFTPNPPTWGFPIGEAGGMTPGGEVEGNAADVQPFTGPNGELLSFVSEEDVDPSLTAVTIASPGAATYTGRGCETLFADKIYLKPGQQISSEVAYIGRGCPASRQVNTAQRAADPYLQDPDGKIAVVESGGPAFENCSFGEKVRRAAEAGATAVVGNLGENALNLFIPGPAGGLPPIPSVGLQLGGYDRIVGAVPNRTLSGVSFPGTWSRTSATNVTVRPLATTVTAATNASPIVITGPAHGLTTGDRVRVAGVQGNTAANGTFTVTVTSPTAFQLDGSTGNGAYTGGGYVVACPPGSTDCAAPDTRTDVSRYRSLANATDRQARGQVSEASRFPVVAGEGYDVGATLEVQERTAGAFEASVVWYDGSGAELATSEIRRLEATSPRTAYEATVTAPSGAVRGAMRFGWSGADAEGLAFADNLWLVPAGLQTTLKDNQGEWGAQRIVDFSRSTPAAIGSYRSPTSQVWPPPHNGVFSPRQARMLAGDIALTTWMSDGLRVLDVRNPGAPREVASFVPPPVADPSENAGAGPTNIEGQTGSLQRGQSWPDQTLVTGVGAIPKGDTSAIVVLSDINAGLYVLEATVRRQAAPTAPPASPTPPSPPASPASPAPPPPMVFPAKLEIERARVRRQERRLDVLAPITGRASGEVQVEFFAAGRRVGFTEEVDAANRRVRFNRRIPGRQARLGTGIVTITYRGDGDTRPQEVRLRAASRRAGLELERPRIVNGRLRAEGTISRRARGVVRMQVQYVVDGKTETVRLRGRIRGGRWEIDHALSQKVRDGIARRRGSVHSYTLFTGYFERRIRGEMRSFQVLGDR
ncbi:MAG TPA: ubiquitin-activating E1 FCCH domain-containing protein [Solirubrobacteraceae bacterium]|nr:ubiquitin-activating E1 FCCH domain-containing protein [Solirubrobacteraceae bacterium]